VTVEPLIVHKTIEDAAIPPKEPEPLIRLYSKNASAASLALPASFGAVQDAANQIIKMVLEVIPAILDDERKLTDKEFDGAARRIAGLITENADQKAQIAELRAGIAELKASIAELRADRREVAAGARGPRGPKGDPGPRITGWIVDEERFSATPVSDQSHGPPLELRGLLTSVARALAEAERA
jgi:hypothetical protein